MRRMPKLDPSTDEFRAAGHKLIDWIGDYLDGVDRYDVLSRVQPGDIAKQFAAEPSRDGRPYGDLLADVESKIIPGITHWNHPAFFAYFANTASQAGILAELLTAALNANGMIWRTSPSAGFATRSAFPTISLESSTTRRRSTRSLRWLPHARNRRRTFVHVAFPRRRHCAFTARNTRTPRSRRERLPSDSASTAWSRSRAMTRWP